MNEHDNKNYVFQNMIGFYFKINFIIKISLYLLKEKCIITKGQ